MKFKNLLYRKIQNYQNNKYETIFSIFMLASAFLFKSNPKIIYPEILYPLFLLMFVNLIYNRYTKKYIYIHSYIMFIISIINLLLIFTILKFSGGINSEFWVLFLLPIFTMATTAIISYFYITAFFVIFGILILYINYPLKDIVITGQLLIKIFIIITGGYIIAKQAKDKSFLEDEIKEKQHNIDMLIEQAEKSISKYENIKEDNIIKISSALHDLKNFLTIISLTSEIMERRKNQNDDETLRIKYISKLSNNLVQFITKTLREEELEIEEVDLVKILEEAIDTINCGFKLYNIKINYIKSNENIKINANNYIF